MSESSPLRAALLALFLLSLGGLPGTIGFLARFTPPRGPRPRGPSRGTWSSASLATVLALSAVGRPLLAMLRPADVSRAASRALSNEQLVLGVCFAIVVYFGVMPIFGETNMSGQLAIWIDRAVASLRP